jgi:hypothetical protein
MTSEGIARVRYFSGQFLRTSDFTEEQSYHRDISRRHNVAHHSFGIVAGLELAAHDGRPAVEPGMAVDGYGRELVLAQRIPLDVPGAFVARGVDQLDVWLAYDLVPLDESSDGNTFCAPATDTSSREIELPRVRYTVADLDETDRRRPASVPPGDVGFGPDRTAPDSPIDDWPVFLGTVARVEERGEVTYTIDLDGRPYAGLIGEEIRAASGRATVQVGAERSDDPFRFAVRIPDLPAPEVPRLAVASDGGVLAIGQTTLLGNVAVGGVVGIESGPAVPDLAAVNAGPWTISHHSAQAGHQELRMQMDDGAGSEVVVGAWKKVTQPDGSEKEQFVPCLTIASDCSITVHGTLVVQGNLITADRNTPTLDADAASIANAAFFSGVAGTSGVLEKLLGPVVVPLAGGGLLRTTRSMITGLAEPPDVDPARFADELAALSTIESVASELRRRHPGAAERLQAALGEGA